MCKNLFPMSVSVQASQMLISLEMRGRKSETGFDGTEVRVKVGQVHKSF